MDECASQRVSQAGMTVVADDTFQLATLRYFTPDGAFGATVQAIMGAPLPRRLQAVDLPAAGAILAWRSPSETLCLMTSAERFAALTARLSRLDDGCLVDLTGGLCVLRVTGDRIADLLCRLGGTASVPQRGDARRGRLADVPVLTLAVRAGEVLLLLDRGHVPHVLAWTRETLLDFPGS
jgi:hypothetical protein